MTKFNNQIRQVILLSVIILIIILMLKYFFVFLPAVLGAITLYIVARGSYQHLTEKKKWKKSWTALLYILIFLVLICLPVYFALILIAPKLVAFFTDPVQLMIAVKSLSDKIEQITHIQIYRPENFEGTFQKLAGNIPALLTGTANFITNVLLMFFILYYMLISSGEMEKHMQNLLPMKKTNRELLGKETIMMIRANAIGIPLLAVIQGLISLLGYYIFGLNQIGVWAFLTGLASLIPIVGTAIVWIPLVIYLFAIGQNPNAIGLLLYSIVITSNVDYVIRVTLLKKIGDVHPMITIVGVIIGLGMFGFWGVVFGPLLVSYFIVLIKIYQNEFYENAE
ncbi:MAG: AI-2E family transporter [Chitinophagaceae bacterium]|nr:AI-2E family transporter [Chitinophagaceae bacterium]